MIPLQDIIQSRRGFLPEITLLCFDPGETSGWAFFQGCDLEAWGQIPTKEAGDSVTNYGNIIKQCNPQHIVIEDYRVYRNKAQEHINAELITPRNIGIIETLGLQQDPIMPIGKQMASMAKQFVTDKRLKSWGYFVEGAPHARDAIRHGCYYLVFSKQIQSPITSQPQQQWKP